MNKNNHAKINNLKNISLWMEQIDLPSESRPSLGQDLNVDVVIVGAGFTGLWTAYYLKQQSPDLNVVILEANAAGYGASGRNGGWLMGEITGQDKLLSDYSEAQRKIAHDVLHSIPDEVARVIKKESIECDFKKGGVLQIAARYPEQKQRLKKHFDSDVSKYYADHDQTWLDKKELDKKIKIDSATAAIYSPHCASIQPAKLVRGLATAVENLGVKIYENTRVDTWKKGSVSTDKYSVTATWVVPALEAYGVNLKSNIKTLKKYHLPVQSLIIATEPLSDEIWQTIGLNNGEVFCEYSRQVTYSLRTSDNRLVFGARGSYQFGAKLRNEFTLSKSEIDLRKNIMVELFPQLKNASITHAWGGNLAISRSFHPHMTIDSANQYALAGGYGGEGVGASNLAGRTLADLMLNKNTTLTQMPWVNKSKLVVKTWEPEPIPWIGYRSILYAFDREDKILSDLNSKNWRRRLGNRVATFMERFVQ